MVADAGGTVVSELRYSAFGEIRYQNGTLTTDYLYTGQRQEAEIGLYYYVARWYDPAIGRFIQADSIVPNPASAKGFDRYGYSYNNPIRYIDPTGHCAGSPHDKYNPDIACWNMIAQIEGEFENVTINNKDKFTTEELVLVYETLNANLAIFNDKSEFVEATGEISIGRDRSPLEAHFTRSSGEIILTDPAFLTLELATGDVSKEDADTYAKYALSHELGHDIGLHDKLDDGAFWWWKAAFGESATSQFADEFWPGCRTLTGICIDGKFVTPGSTDYGKTDSAEDFADTYAWIVANNSSWNINQFGYAPPSDDRQEFLLSLIK